MGNGLGLLLVEVVEGIDNGVPVGGFPLLLLVVG